MNSAMLYDVGRKKEHAILCLDRTQENLAGRLFSFRLCLPRGFAYITKHCAVKVKEGEQRMEALRVYPKPKRYPLLRGKMEEKGVTGIYMARKLKMKSASGFSHRMTGRQPWRLDEAYDVMRILGIPPERIHEYFPDYGGKRV